MIVFKPLQQADLPLLHSWLNQAHLRKFYQQNPISLEDVVKKYTSRIEGTASVHCHVAYFESQPIGKIQCYKNKDYPLHAQEIGVHDGLSIDLFIGEPAFLGKGLGKKMLQSYLTNIVFKIFENEKYCYICHEKENSIAIGCSQACGFIFIKDIIEQGKPSKLFKFSRH